MCICIYVSLSIVPLPSLSITVRPSSSVYESTSITLECIIAFTNTLQDVTVHEEGHWLGPNGMRIYHGGRFITTQTSVGNAGPYNRTLTISPVDNGDNGQYNDSGNYTYLSTTTANGIQNENTVRDSVVIEITGKLQIFESFHVQIFASLKSIFSNYVW